MLSIQTDLIRVRSVGLGMDKMVKENVVDITRIGFRSTLILAGDVASKKFTIRISMFVVPVVK